jgi:hypothetical protein
MPGVAHGPGPTAKPPRVREAEGFGPVPDGFVRDDDAALREDVFDVSEAQGEAVVRIRNTVRVSSIDVTSGLE